MRRVDGYYVSASGEQRHVAHFQSHIENVTVPWNRGAVDNRVGAGRPLFLQRHASVSEAQ